MADTAYAVGATSKIVTVEAIVISTGLPYTAGVFNTATISATYTKDGAAPTTITLVTATAGTYTSSGFVHRGKGVYEIGAPALAFSTAVDGVNFAVDGIANVLFRGCRVDLFASNPRLAAVTPGDIATALAAHVINGTFTIRQVLIAIAATTAGKLSGAGTGTETIRDMADTTNVVVSTVDASGNRTAETYSFPA